MTLTLKKATHQDLEHQARENGLGYFVDVDYDKSFIYFSKGSYEGSDDVWLETTTQYPFTLEGGVLTIDHNSGKPVVRNTSYVDAEPTVKQEISSIKKMLKSLFTKPPEVTLLKQFDEKTRTVHEPLYTPYGKVDAHGDTYKDRDSMLQLVDNLESHKADLQKAINHRCKTNCFDIVKAWVNEEETVMDGVTIPKDQPMVTLRYTEKAFELRKAGRLLGPSIGCSSKGLALIKSLKDLPIEQRASRFIYDFDFSRKRDHLSLTTPSVGGPCSMEDWFVEVDLEKNFKDPDDIALLEELGEEFIALEKQAGSVDKEEEALSTSDEEREAGVDEETLNKGKETTMSEEEKNELITLRKEALAYKIKDALSKYDLAEEVVQGFVSSAPSDEVIVNLTKALDTLVDRIESAEAEKVLLSKSLEDKGSTKDKTRLEKAMESEEGEGQSAGFDASDDDLATTLRKYREMEDK